VVLLLAPLYGAVWLVRRLGRDAVWRGRFRRVVDAVPGFGAGARRQRRARFAMVLEAGYEAGMRLDGALALAGRVTGDEAAEGAARDVAGGIPLSTALARTGALSHASVGRLAAAEHAGELGGALRAIAAEESAGAEALLRRATTTLSTLVVLLVLGVIGAFVIAFYLRLYEPFLR
jgi:type II secretory pathway component PulF